MTTSSLKFRVDASLSQQFKSAVTMSQQHDVLMHIAKKKTDFTKQSNYGPVNVYVVVFNITRNPNGPAQILRTLNQQFSITKLADDHYYVG